MEFEKCNTGEKMSRYSQQGIIIALEWGSEAGERPGGLACFIQNILNITGVESSNSGIKRCRQIFYRLI